MGHARAVDIGVEQSDPAPGAGQTDGDARGDRALANAPLTRADGDHALRLEADLTELHRRPLVGRDRHLDVGDRRKPGPQHLLDPCPRGGVEDCGMARKPDGDGDPAGFDVRRHHLPGIGQRPSRLRIGDGGKDKGDSRAIGSRHGWIKA